MAFERIRQEKEAEEIRRQQREKAVADAARIEKQQRATVEQQREAAAKVERERIETERQKALAFREESGVVGKLREFTELIERLHLSLDTGDRSTPTSIADKIVWDQRIIRSVPLPGEERREGYIITKQENFYTENYLHVETFPDGTIDIRGRAEVIPFTIFGFTILEGKKGATASIRSQYWRASGSTIFEEPIYNAFRNPLVRNWSNISENRELPGSTE